jgi:hypothetical protein
MAVPYYYQNLPSCGYLEFFEQNKLLLARHPLDTSCSRVFAAQDETSCLKEGLVQNLQHYNISTRRLYSLHSTVHLSNYGSEKTILLLE